MDKPSISFTSIGGQAVIEGVMMRSPHFISVAVRQPNQRIVLQNKSYQGIGDRYPILKKPVLRGVIGLFESMVQGMGALSYSAQMAVQTETPTQPLSSWAIAGSMLLAFPIGIGLFVALPHLLTVLLTSVSFVHFTVESPWFHLIDGLIKIGILLAYVYLIALMKDIHRVFQYHGAEHKSIYTFEAGEELTVENARKYTTLHPRCGTSFLLFLILISVAVFSIVFPLLKLTHLSSVPIVNHIAMIGLKMLLMFPVAGLSYEFIKACAFRMQNPLFRMLVWPGMVLQKLTTREPTDDQLEVALASLKQVLRLEQDKRNSSSESRKIQPELEITRLSDLGRVQIQVSEFPEI